MSEKRPWHYVREKLTATSEGADDKARTARNIIARETLHRLQAQRSGNIDSR